MEKIRVIKIRDQINYVYCIFFSLIAFFISFIMIGLYPNYDNYSFLFILPLGYSIVNLLGVNTYKYFFKSKVITIIYIGYFIKMVISPFCFALGEYKSFFDSSIHIENSTKAILFMCIEYLFIVLFSKGINFYSLKIIIEKNYNLKKVLLIISIICLFLIIAYNIVPELKQIYIFIKDINFNNLVNIRWDNETIVARGSFKRYIYSLFMFFWPIIRFILPATLIYLTYSKNGECKKGVFISSIWAFIPFIILGGDNLAPFIATIFSLIVIMKLFPNKSKKIIKIFIILGTIFIGMLVIEKLLALKGWRGATGITNLAQLLNAYFPGFDNINLAMKMEGNNKLNTLFFDIYSGIPFLGSIFSFHGKTLNHLYVEFINTGGQIVPWGCNIGYYTTYFLSPFITGITIRKILKIEKASEEKKDFWKYYISMLFSTYTAISIIIYSTQIYLRIIWNIILPIFIIIKISKISIRRQYFEKKI